MTKQQSSWELIVLNPSFAMGLSLTSMTQSESLKFMADMLSGKYKMGVAELNMGYVDVSDVVKAHVFCLENKAEGCHILSERVTDLLSYANIIRAQYGNSY